MRVVRFNNSSIERLSHGTGIEDLWVLLDERGYAAKEIGFSSAGEEVHRFPGEGALGRYGVLDSAKIECQSDSGMRIEDFENMWNRSQPDPLGR